jgi:ABC-2 type transport system permease protein
MTSWPLRIALSRLRPFNAASNTRTAIVAAVFGSFLYGDYKLFDRLFGALRKVEAATPFFALGLLRNLLALVFLVASVVLFSSALTAAIGAFFSDLDLDLYHAAPRSKLRIALARWIKTLGQSAAVVFAFLVPLFAAFAANYRLPRGFVWLLPAVLGVLLTLPVTLAASVILVLVRFFPVRRVHQIVATLAILVLTLAVVAFRMSRPERFFMNVSTDDVVQVLRAVELPSMDLYPSTALATLMTDVAAGAPAGRSVIRAAASSAIPAAAAFALFVVIARAWYFAAFVRARETMAPVALGGTFATRLSDRLFAPLDIQTRALVAREVRTLTRDVAQWSQLFLMAALLFIYLYNIRMLPLGGDARAGIVAYANLGMAGFVVAAICLRFAYPSVSAEGKAFWLVQSAPVGYRRFLLVKVFVYAVPLTLLALLLTTFANALLHADRWVWAFTLAGAALIAVTLVSLGVGLGGLAPDFAAENPLQVGLSLGGFAYMALSLSYVGTVMLLLARPIVRYFFWRAFGLSDQHAWVATAVPVVIAITVSISLIVFPLLAAEKRLTRLGDR